MMTWSVSDEAPSNALRAKHGLPPLARSTVPLPSGPATFVGDGPPASPEVAAAHEAWLKAHPPQPEDIVLNQWYLGKSRPVVPATAPRQPALPKRRRRTAVPAVKAGKRPACRLPLVLFALLLSLFFLLQPARAILDGNGNGISDIVEKVWNGGAMPATPYDPLANPDGDLWDNATEAVAGTNPFSGVPANNGFVTPAVEIIPATYTSTGGATVVATPETLLLTWPSVPGKAYQVEFSSGLAPGTWTPVSDPMVALETTMGKAITLTQEDGSAPGRLFFRLAITDTNSDADGLGDAEEYAIGTDPYRPDSDNDGVRDGDELALYHTNPLSAADLDGDGIPDDFEKQMAAQLLAADPSLEHWSQWYAGLQAGDLDASHDYTGDGVPTSTFVPSIIASVSAPLEDSGILIESQVRDIGLGGSYYTDADTGMEKASGLCASSSDLSFKIELASRDQFVPATLMENISSIPWQSASVFTPEKNIRWPHVAGEGVPGWVMSFFMGPWKEPEREPEYGGCIRHYRHRLASNDINHPAFFQTFVKVTERAPIPLRWNTYDCPPLEWTAIAAEIVTLELPRKRLLGDWLELAAPMQNNSSTTVTLAPVRFEQSGNSTPAIRFCNWSTAFPDNQFDKDFADTSPDRFRIVIPKVIPGLTKVRIKSTGIKGAIIGGLWDAAKTTDGDYDVDLISDGASMRSEGILLVGDGDDDINFNGKGIDNGRNDQTLLADFDSEIVVSLPELGGGKNVFPVQKPVGTVTLDVVYLSPAGDLPQNMRGAIQRQVAKMAEIYRQLGIRVQAAAICGESIPQAWLDEVPGTDPNKPVKEPKDHLNSAECQAARTQVRRHSASQHYIRIGYIAATLAPNEFSSFERAYGFTDLGTDGIIVSLTEDARKVIGVTSHEAGHAMKLDHVDPDYLLMKRRMRWNNDHRDSKRFDSDGFPAIEKSYYYVPSK